MSFNDFFVKAYKEFDIIIVGIFGRNNELGEGKTLLLSYLAYEFHKQLPKKDIYADYNLPFLKGQIHHMNDFVKCFDCAMFLDDVIPIFDCRQSMSSVLQTWILNTCRKYKISLFYTSQLKGAIDGRLRKISNFIIETEKKEFPIFELWAFSDTVFTLLLVEDIDSIKELLIPYGFELVAPQQLNTN